MSDKQPRPRGSVRLEAQPEEAFADLLPYEMERTEFIMGTFFADHTKKSIERIEKNAVSDMPVVTGKKDWDRVREEDAKIDEITAGIAAAREPKVNNWGHRWRPSPTVEAEHFSKEDKVAKSLDGDPIRRAPFPPDPILDAAVAEYKASPNYQAPPQREHDGDPNEKSLHWGAPDTSDE
jgi:hypothetical protein